MRLVIKMVVTVAFAAALSGGPVYAARANKPSGGGHTSGSSSLGNDISWPQCGKTFPYSQAFGIVGVNGGVATSTNPCLSDELAWAAQSNGIANQPKMQLYVNTANPGGLNTSTWPTSNADPSGTSTDNPNGTCDGSDSLACAWQYGWNRAVDDINLRLVPAALSSGQPYSASLYHWWLDVETANTWKTGTTQFDYQSNVAVLEGMAAHLEGAGASVGIYSTSYQWDQITGGYITINSNLTGLDNWLPGARSQKAAKSNCTKPALTIGGRVTLTQFVSNNLDYDYSCQ